jgi:hypothetical protein
MKPVTGRLANDVKQPIRNTLRDVLGRGEHFVAFGCVDSACLDTVARCRRSERLCHDHKGGRRSVANAGRCAVVNVEL